ncbi:MAG: transcriptional antiterminator [Oscillospiraceae bacterium]|nr:transcriptional antiterminator [Oscillospiraceae bacterium]
MALLHINFESQYLNGNTDVNIILPDKPRTTNPDDFYGNGEKYPVLWLLHGTFGDYTDWIRKSNIELYACEKNLIVVMPSALNSNYSNWDTTMMGYGMYDYLIKELMPLVHNWLPASDKREDNFISGLSMGGEGALKYAVNFPDKFAGVAVLSMFARDWENIKPEFEYGHQRTLNGYANAGGYENFINSYENIRRLLLQQKDSGTLPKMYFAVGKQDFLYKGYKEFKKWAVENGLDITFSETKGYKHEWRFWDKEIQNAIEFFGLADKPDEGNPF